MTDRLTSLSRQEELSGNIRIFEQVAMAVKIMPVETNAHGAQIAKLVRPLRIGLAGA